MSAVATSNDNNGREKLPYIYSKGGKFIVIPPKKGVASRTFTDYDEAKNYLIEVRDVLPASAYQKLMGEVKHLKVKDLFAKYKERTFPTLAARSREQYDLCLRWAEKEIGEQEVRSITRKVADNLHQYIAQTHSLGSANKVVAVLRAAFSFAVRQELVGDNPFTKMKLKAVPARTQRWTPEQVKAALKWADKLGFKAVALTIALMYDTAQRESDIRSLTWDKYKDGKLSFTQSKRGVEVTIPLSRATIKLLDKRRATSKSNTIVPKDALFHKHFGVVKVLAELPKELWIRDLRRTVVTEMFEAGASTSEVMAAAGFQNEASVKPYAVRVGNEDLAASALNKRRNNK
jgi:integrase